MKKMQYKINLILVIVIICSVSIFSQNKKRKNNSINSLKENIIKKKKKELKIWELEGMDTYPVNIEGYFCYIHVDVGLGKKAPLKDYKFFHSISVKLNNNKRGELLSTAENNQLYKIEDYIIPIIEKAIVGIYVGRDTAYNRRNFYFYGKLNKIKSDIINTIIDEFENNEFSSSVDKDAEWRKYFGSLYPNEPAYHHIITRRIIYASNIPVQNKNISISLIHYIYFKNETKKNAFVLEAKQKKLKCMPELKNYFESCGKYRIKIKTKSNLALYKIYREIEKLVFLANENNGKYSHWESDDTKLIYTDLSKEVKLLIATEYLSGFRDKKDLTKFKIKIKRKATGNAALNLLKSELKEEK